MLEIGCGTGRNLIVAARRYPAARFYGIDVSTEMLTKAIDSLGTRRPVDRVRVAHGDATAFDAQRLFGRERFDRIFISYSLSMIPDWNGAIDRALALLAPGGELHIVDFGGQSGWAGPFRAVLRRWLTLFHVTPRDGLERWLSECAKRSGAMLTLERPFRDYAKYAVCGWRLALRRLPGRQKLAHAIERLEDVLGRIGVGQPHIAFAENAEIRPADDGDAGDPPAATRPAPSPSSRCA